MIESFCETDPSPNRNLPCLTQHLFFPSSFYHGDDTSHHIVTGPHLSAFEHVFVLTGFSDHHGNQERFPRIPPYEYLFMSASYVFRKQSAPWRVRMDSTSEYPLGYGLDRNRLHNGGKKFLRTNSRLVSAAKAKMSREGWNCYIYVVVSIHL